LKLITFLRDWALPISIVTGIVAYFVFVALPLPAATHIAAGKVVAVVQPAMLFAMLFLSFCRISPHDLRLCPWHLWLLLTQVLLFVLPAVWLLLCPDGLSNHAAVIIESAMLCLICPTATAAAVIVGKLKGHPAHVVTYTVIINLTVSLLIPLFAPLLHPHPDLSFLSSFLRLMARMFPLLIFPLLLAWMVRYSLPKVNEKLRHTGDLAFYIWAVSLSIAIAMSTRSIVHSNVGFRTLAGIALASLLCCVFQFTWGRAIGSRYDVMGDHTERTTAGQSLGQKNTILLIWLSYTFFTPVTAIAGGFYCIWHNLINAWQLYRQRRESTLPTSVHP
jgi:BASS family bile acid:Na+ symporter